MLALLSPDGVRRALLTALTNGDATVLDDRIAYLVGGSIITHTADRDALRMHWPVTRVIREWHRAEGNYPGLIATTVTLLDDVVEALVSLRSWSVRQLTRSVNLDRAITPGHHRPHRLPAAARPGASHTLGSANNLAIAYASAGRLEQAIPPFEQTPR